MRFRVQGPGFEVFCSRVLRVFGFRGWGLRDRVRVWGLGFWGLRFGVLGFWGFRVLGF